MIRDRIVRRSPTVERIRIVLKRIKGNGGRRKGPNPRVGNVVESRRNVSSKRSRQEKKSQDSLHLSRPSSKMKRGFEK
jgi:hypothetical protein